MKKCLFSMYPDLVWCPTWLKNLGRYLFRPPSDYCNCMHTKKMLLKTFSCSLLYFYSKQDSLESENKYLYFRPELAEDVRAWHKKWIKVRTCKPACWFVKTMMKIFKCCVFFRKSELYLPKGLRKTINNWTLVTVAWFILNCSNLY